jgi:ribonuclease III
MNLIEEFEKMVGVVFEDKQLLQCALTHSSYAKRKGSGPKKMSDNERLEFFGDAVLKLIVSEYLYVKYPDYDEGKLTKIRAKIISDAVLAKMAKHLELGEYMLFSYGEKSSGGKVRSSNLANALEAILGACYIDGGYEASKQLFLKLLAIFEAKILSSDELSDYKTTLQEYMQKRKSELPIYTVQNEDGPDHSKIFVVEVSVEMKSKIITDIGRGKTKKEAEQAAARSVYLKLSSTTVPLGT